ncbi:MAG: AbrB/MazE/SpoVT family DNA-binding domain-containing protein [Pyrinomonadaceae bacterium]
MITETTKLADGFRIVIPKRVREKMNIKIGDALTLVVDDESGELKVCKHEDSVKRTQEMIAKYVSSEKSLVSELLRERRREAKNE